MSKLSEAQKKKIKAVFSGVIVDAAGVINIPELANKIFRIVEGRAALASPAKGD